MGVQSGKNEAIAPWLIKAKVSPPRQNATVFFRQDLTRRLCETRHRSMTFIEAPAGFGKSTLLAHSIPELAKDNVVTAWLSTEETDDPDTYISYMAFAFHVAGLDMIETGLLSAHFKGEYRITYGLSAFIAAVERSGKSTVLVLDDFDRASNKVIQEVVTRLLANLPENLHLVIACRHNPGLSLSRLEIGGLLHRINAEDLRLGYDEVYKIFGPSLTEEEAQLILKRTAGWPVVIQLLRSMCGNNPIERQSRISSFTGASDQAAAYFTEQLFDSFDREQGRFLVETSVLEHVSPEAADALRDRSDSQAILDSLEGLESLFPESEPGGQIRRLHPLLREHLEATLLHLEPEKHAALHCKAAQHSFKRGDINRAIAHANKANDDELAGAFVERGKGLQIWISEGMYRLEDLLGQLSVRVLDTFPRLILACAVVEMKKGHIREAQRYIVKASEASQGFTQDRIGGNGDLLLKDKYLTEALMLGYRCLPFHDHLSSNTVSIVLENTQGDHTINGFIQTIECISRQQIGDFDRAIRKAREATVEFRLGHSIYGELFVCIHEGMIALAQARMSDVKSCYGLATKLSREYFPVDKGLKAILDTCWAEYYWEMGDHRAVQRHIGKVSQTLDNREAWFDIYMAAFRTIARSKLLEQDITGLDTFFEAAFKHSQAEDLGRLENLLKALQISTYLDCGRQVQALELYRDWTITGTLNSSVWREQEMLCVAQARALAHLDDRSTAISKLTELSNTARNQGNNRNLSYALCWIIALADPDRQVKDLSCAFNELTEMQDRLPGTQVLSILGERTTLLKGLATTDSAKALITLVSRTQAEEHNKQPLFSRRELQVLDQLAKGLSDKEIARILEVTSHTIRFHLKNIYAKTGARNRIEALNLTSSVTKPTEPTQISR